MKIKGNPPRQAMAHSRGQFVFGRGTGGRVVVQRWPRKRVLAKLPNITKQQVIAWDAVQHMVPLALADEFSTANQAVKNTAFYTRDILIMAAYGHYISWPGWGVYPTGQPTAHKRHRKWRFGEIKQRHFGNPQKVNQLKTLDSYKTKTSLRIDITTHMNTNPTLAIFCCDEKDVGMAKMKAGEMIPHGNKKFLDCDPAKFFPTIGSGTIHSWDVALSNAATQCPECKYMIFEPEAQPFLHWQSQLHKCPPALQNWVDFWAETSIPTGALGEQPVFDRVQIDQQGDIDSFAGGVGQPRTVRCPRTGHAFFSFGIRCGGSRGPTTFRAVIRDLDTGIRYAVGPTVTVAALQTGTSTAVMPRTLVPAGPGFWKLAMYVELFVNTNATSIFNRTAPSAAYHWPV